MREFALPEGADPFNVSAAARRVAALRVPLQVGPYFRTSAQEPVVLGEFAAAAGRQVRQERCAGWARFGTDRGFELCADGEGVVRAVLLDYQEDHRFVNSSPEAFATGLLDLRRALGVILGTDDPQAASTAYDSLSQRLRETDPQAFEERESWWPLVLDDIRDTANAQWYAAFEYLDHSGQKQIVTQGSAVSLHPEERLWDSLRSAGLEAEQVLRVHTDLQPCFMPGHYCSMWLAQVFPEAGMTHSFPYGESAESRAAGLRRMAEEAGS
ncbi:SUKH-4 family immunity protein [Streptomyces sp. P38-E01]|uniref:SUKH-4 family immunity protein n=1 Tax=Streptomyces tardus TaxID=2780544 RepID=A0A949JSG5_9ACTN|nr:nucleic acid/nucleotide deaminase domain-containing protein [Streptomyces tardus]MBU7600406.1 SUKH-4 family immunity protein [Streptomyces tardus]